MCSGGRSWRIGLALLLTLCIHVDCNPRVPRVSGAGGDARRDGVAMEDHPQHRAPPPLWDVHSLSYRQYCGKAPETPEIPGLRPPDPMQRMQAGLLVHKDPIFCSRRLTAAVVLGNTVLFVVIMAASCYVHGKALLLLRQLRRCPAQAVELESLYENTQCTPQTITFSRLCYYVKTSSGKRKAILSDVSGYCAPGSLVSIMGPSGSGKTTLLNLLSGRAKFGEYSGQLKLNACTYPVNKYRALMKQQGYVLQTDYFLEDLTVRQTMDFAAAMKLPCKSPEARHSIVCRLLNRCGLESAAHNLIGGVTFKGISGGQRRRLSIAEQLLVSPSILLLDEPTSGLDGTSSLKLVRLLKGFARRGHTIVTTIHQPRPEIMAIFTHLMLLATGGHVAYFGAAEDAVGYLVRTEAVTPVPGANPGDVIIDALDLDPESDRRGAEPVDLAAVYCTSPQASATTRAIRTLCADLEERGCVPVSAKRQQHLCNAMVVLLARRLARKYSPQNRIKALLNGGQVVLVSAVLALCFMYDCSNKFGEAYKQMMFIILAASYVCIVQYLISVPELFSERQVLNKERESGDYRFVSYLLMTMSTESPRAVLHTVIVLAMGWLLVGIDSDGPKVLAQTAMFVWTAMSFQALMCFISFCTDNSGLAYSVIFLVVGIGCVTNGLLIEYENVFFAIQWAYYGCIQSYLLRVSVLINMLSNPALQIDCNELSTVIQTLRHRTNRTHALQEATVWHDVCFAEGGDRKSFDAGALTLAMMGWSDGWFVTSFLIVGVHLVVCRALTLLLMSLRTYLSFKLHEIPRDVEEGSRSPAHVEEGPSAAPGASADQVLLTMEARSPPSPISETPPTSP